MPAQQPSSKGTPQDRDAGRSSYWAARADSRSPPRCLPCLLRGHPTCSCHSPPPRAQRPQNFDDGRDPALATGHRLQCAITTPHVRETADGAHAQASRSHAELLPRVLATHRKQAAHSVAVPSSRTSRRGRCHLNWLLPLNFPTRMLSDYSSLQKGAAPSGCYRACALRTAAHWQYADPKKASAGTVCETRSVLPVAPCIQPMQQILPGYHWTINCLEQQLLKCRVWPHHHSREDKASRPR